MQGRLVRGVLLVLAAAVVAVVRILPLSLYGASDSDRAQLTWRAEDGREHPYLGGYDGYFWVRAARNRLRTGTACDAVVAGDCRNDYTSAPVGSRMRYDRSLHIAAITGLHRLIRLFEPRHPLTASAYWVPVVVGVIGVLPAFAIGVRLAGTMGGFVAALAIGVNPLFIQRSVGADNDVWNVTLPLCAVWAAMAALASANRLRVAGLAALASGLVGLHAATWRGWTLTYVVVLAGLGASVAVAVARTLRSGPRPRGPLGNAATALVIFWLATAAATALAGARGDPLWQRLGAERFWLSAAPPAAEESVAWPDAFLTVGELAQPAFGEIADRLSGPAYLLAAWLGLLLLFLPERRWQWWHFALLIGGTLLFRGLFAVSEPGRASLLVVVAALPTAALVIGLLAREADHDAVRPDALIVAAWFLATLFLAFNGLRFVMLLVPPFGLLLGVASGRLYGWLVRVVSPLAGRHAPRAAAAAFIIVAIALLPSVRLGVAAGRDYRPRMNDAWWDALMSLRDSSSPDAIVSTWWDYGHWVTYVAERRVTNDGSTLRSHVPHWLGRALLAPTERETAGLLRMLDCGSDATPAPEGRLGAWGKLVDRGVDPVAAHGLVIALANRDLASARDHLTARGLTPEAAREVLQSTHCQPPPGYLVLSSQMFSQYSWRAIGAWDPLRAWLAGVVGRQPEAEILAELSARFDATPVAATALYQRAARIDGADAIAEFAAPRLRYLMPRWRPCQGPEDGPWTCAIGLRTHRGGPVLAAVEVHPDAPEATRLRTSEGDRDPDLLLVAGEQRMDAVTVANPSDDALGVLVDVPGRRVLLGSPDLLRSTFTQLMFLDGRLLRRFERVDDRAGYAGERVRTFRLRWGPIPAGPHGWNEDSGV